MKIELTPYNEEVYLQMRPDRVEDSFGEFPPKSLIGKKVHASRTGSHTWQPLKYDKNGFKFNISVEWVEKVMTKETHPEEYL